MTATRLLVVAEPKMLTALANGLRIGGRFEIATAPFAEPSVLAPLAANADVVALFYGSRQFPLQPALQELSSSLRARGARLIAVLQKDQAHQRDECFHSGASDLLFMPMPKDQFVARLIDAARLALAEEEGLPAQVSFVTRGQPAQVCTAKVTQAGVIAPTGPALGVGETVQLSWPVGPADFSRWGLVVQSGDGGLRVRIAGSSAEEDLQLRAWVKGLPSPIIPPPPASAQEPAQPTPPGANAPASAAKSSSSGPITAGPPPGFAARPPIRPQRLRASQATAPGRPRSIDGAPGTTGEHAPVRGPTPSDPYGARAPAAEASASSQGSTRSITPPKGSTPFPGTLTPAGSVQQAASAEGAAAGGAALPPVNPSGAAATAPAQAEGAPAQPNSLSSLFDEQAGAGTAEVAPELAALPTWPTPLDAALARSLLAMMLREKSLPSDAPEAPAAAVRKVIGAMPSIDREALEAVGADSHLHEALVARVQLVHANTEGVALCSRGAGALVDDAGLLALTQSAGSASKRLQAEADRAITKGEVETLQQVTAASAALSREMLAFKETADRLHGLAAAPRLGASGLDPHITATSPGQKPVSLRRDKDKEKDEQHRAEKRAEQRKAALSEFTGLQDDTPKAAKQKRYLYIGLGLLALSIGNAIWFAPGVRSGSASLVEQAGPGVLQLVLSEKSAIVSVAPTWVNAMDRKARLRAICDTLDGKGIKRAAFYVEGKGMIGQLDVTSCQALGLAPPKPPSPELGGQPEAPH